MIHPTDLGRHIITYLTNIVHLATYITAIVALPGILVALFKTIYEIDASRKQRASELRWKQANAAKELLDDILNYELTKQAIHMLDWVDGSAEYTAGNAEYSINYPDVLNALAMNHGEKCDKRNRHVRDCFDWLFYRIDRIEHYIRRELIQFEDVRDVFKVYAFEIGLHKDIYKEFFEFHKYDLGWQFFQRYWERDRP